MYHNDGRGIILKFRIAKDTDTKDVKRLWAYCFEPEGHPFFNYYLIRLMNQKIRWLVSIVVIW